MPVDRFHLYRQNRSKPYERRANDCESMLQSVKRLMAQAARQLRAGPVKPDLCRAIDRHLTRGRRSGQAQSERGRQAIASALVQWQGSRQWVGCDPVFHSLLAHHQRAIGALQVPPAPSGLVAAASEPAHRSVRPTSAQAVAAQPATPAVQAPRMRPPASRWPLPPSPPRAAAEPFGHPVDGRVISADKQPLRHLQQSPDPGFLRTLGHVDIHLRGKTRRRSFRASVITSREGLCPLIMGSAIAGGAFSKVVPMVYRAADGQLRTAVGKMMRKEPARCRPAGAATEGDAFDGPKSLFNRFGGRRDQVGTDADFEHEMAMQRQLGGAVQVLGSRSYDDKRLLLMTSMDMSLQAALSLLDEEERRSFARAALSQLASHYADIHAKGFLHGDGKLANALVRFEDGTVSHSDFGGAVELEPDERALLGTYTYLSPEACYSHARVGAAHDVYTLGLSGLGLLSGRVLPDSLIGRQIGTDGRTHLDATASTLLRLSELRARLTDWEVAEQRPEDAIDADDFEVEIERNDPTALALDDAFATDHRLASYLLVALLNPDEDERATSSEAAAALHRLAAETRSESDQVFARLEHEARGMSRAQDKLMRVAELYFGAGG